MCLHLCAHVCVYDGVGGWVFKLLNGFRGHTRIKGEQQSLYEVFAIF